MKSYTDLEQSKKLAEILPLESADMFYNLGESQLPNVIYGNHDDFKCYLPCWSLSALLNILHSKTKNIPSLSGGGYKDGKYISDWCLDYEFDDGDYQKTFADNPVDACYEMIIKLNEQKLL